MFQPEHHWQPAAQRCHAIAGTLPPGPHRAGERLTTLCEQHVTAAEPSALNWLWPTCPECLRAAGRMPENAP
ncbi:zinc finger protein [Saccharopolyspora hirsuta]|uniref:Zinc-finger domain-containing protein n=1 Tax=Saccharopolyspora hirsuta TaxID=1837 RepID=A0A5M7B6I1_SACHI|nr:zinc finger protein [Saccharopolyspora hirsuta]KAA5824942.1 hypothetical protein F1721_33890 [Saccharopolyspora hirsuta]